MTIAEGRERRAINGISRSPIDLQIDQLESVVGALGMAR